MEILDRFIVETMGSDAVQSDAAFLISECSTGLVAGLYINRLRQGPHTYYHSRSPTIYNYLDDQLHGCSIELDRNSVVRAIKLYSRGKKHGKQLYFHTNGVRCIEENYTNDILDGSYKHWDVSENLEFHVEYTNGVKTVQFV